VTTLLQVALGGALGSALRWLLGLAVLRVAPPGFPLAILSVNVLGSFLMGVCVVALARWEMAPLSPLLMTGVLGGFTTFSAFSLEAVTLIERGQAVAAALYVGLSVGVSITALALGVRLARGVL
jgi:CrcB protein